MSDKNAKTKVEVKGSVKFSLSSGKVVDLTLEEYDELKELVADPVPQTVSVRPFWLARRLELHPSVWF